jgi:Arc/MetJ family transcription regulator
MQNVRPASPVPPSELESARFGQFSCLIHRLTGMHSPLIFMHMRTTLIIDDELLERAQKLSGIREKTAVVHAGLDALIARESARRLAALGGTDKAAKAVRRRRPQTAL